MKNKLTLTKSIMISFLGLWLIACSVSEDDTQVNSINKVGSYNSNKNIYDTLDLEGEFAENIAEYTLTLTNSQGQTFDLALVKPTSSKIKAFVSKDFVPGKYSVSLSKGGKVTKLQDFFSKDVEVFIRKRPIIMSASKTSFAIGASITLTGENFLNTSGSTSYDPEIWIMKTGYSNNVSKVVLNAGGTVANVTISNSSTLLPGQYDLFLITSNGSSEVFEPWSNPLKITITQ